MVFTIDLVIQLSSDSEAKFDISHLDNVKYKIGLLQHLVSNNFELLGWCQSCEVSDFVSVLKLA